MAKSHKLLIGNGTSGDEILDEKGGGEKEEGREGFSTGVQSKLELEMQINREREWSI